MSDTETVDRSSAPRTESDASEPTPNEADSRSDDEDASGPDAAVVRRAIRARAESIRRSELRRAFDRLDAQGDLTDADRRVVAQMAETIVDGVLAAPESALTDSRRRDGDSIPDDDPVEAVANLFGSDR